MQQHVKVEIALEVLENRIANTIKEITSIENLEDKKKLEKELQELLNLKEKAYKGEKDIIETILKN